MTKSLTEQDNQALLLRLVAGDDTARRALIEGNNPLVFWLADQFARRSARQRVLYPDLIGEGSLALIEAVDRLVANELREASIATYLRRSIEHAMRHFIDREHPITIPDRTQREQRQYAEWVPKLQKLHQQGKTFQALAKWLGNITGTKVPTDVIRRLLNPIKPPKRVGPKAFNSIAAPDELAACDMRDLIMSCAENSLQREMLLLFEKGFNIKQIHDAIGIPMGTIFNWREEIYAKVREKAGLKEQKNED